MLADVNLITSTATAHPHHEMIFIDGQLTNKSTMANNKFSNSAELELMLMKMPSRKANGGNLTNNVNATSVLGINAQGNSRPVGEPLEMLPLEGDGMFELDGEQSDRLVGSAFNGHQLALAMPDPNSTSSENVLSIPVPTGYGHHMNGDLEASATSISVGGSQDKIDTATADVIISEYPAECFPEGMYRYCPWCLDETTFWKRWKALRLRCYQIVEHKYFETLVIILILFSSMCLVRFRCHIFPL